RRRRARRRGERVEDGPSAYASVGHSLGQETGDGPSSGRPADPLRTGAGGRARALGETVRLQGDAAAPPPLEDEDGTGAPGGQLRMSGAQVMPPAFLSGRAPPRPLSRPRRSSISRLFLACRATWAGLTWPLLLRHPGLERLKAGVTIKGPGGWR